MTDLKITQLPIHQKEDGDALIPAVSGGQSKSIKFSDMADIIWDQMYIRVKKVIITCSHCGSANVMTNSNCVSCGAGLGEDILKS